MIQIRNYINLFETWSGALIFRGYTETCKRDLHLNYPNRWAKDDWEEYIPTVTEIWTKVRSWKLSLQRSLGISPCMNRSSGSVNIRNASPGKIVKYKAIIEFKRILKSLVNLLTIDCCTFIIFRLLKGLKLFHSGTREESMDMRYTVLQKHKSSIWILSFTQSLWMRPSQMQTDLNITSSL